MKEQFFLILEPKFDRRGVLQSFNTRAVKNRPTSFTGVAVAMTLDVPTTVFKPFIPDVTITVEGDQTWAPTVEIEAPPTTGDNK